MTNPQIESIARQRRDHQIALIQPERERVQRELANVIGATGTARPAAQTAQPLQVADELEARRARIAGWKATPWLRSSPRTTFRQSSGARNRLCRPLCVSPELSTVLGDRPPWRDR